MLTVPAQNADALRRLITRITQGFQALSTGIGHSTRTTRKVGYVAWLLDICRYDRSANDLILAKVKDRFPTYFEYHELAQEIPLITAQMEQDAQNFGAWKAKALSGSEDGSQGSFLNNNNRPRSRSIETTASYERPVFEVFEVGYISIGLINLFVRVLLIHSG